MPCAGSGRQLPEVHARPRPRRRPVPAADSGERASAGDSYLPETRRRRRGVRVPAGVGLRVTETAARRRPLPTAGAEVPLPADPPPALPSSGAARLDRLARPRAGRPRRAESSARYVPAGSIGRSPRGRLGGLAALRIAVGDTGFDQPPNAWRKISGSQHAANIGDETVLRYPGSINSEHQVEAAKDQKRHHALRICLHLGV